MLFACWRTGISGNGLLVRRGDRTAEWLNHSWRKKRKILPPDAIQLASPGTSVMQVCLLSSLTAHPKLVSIHIILAQKSVFKGCPTSHQRLRHTDVIWAPEPRSLMLTHFLFYQSIRLHLKRCSACLLPAATPPARPQKPAQHSAPGSPPPSPTPCWRGSGTDWPNSDPLTQPLRAAPRVAQPSPRPLAQTQKRCEDSESQALPLQEKSSVGYS